MARVLAAHDAHGVDVVALAPLYHIVAGVTLRYFFPYFAAWLIAPRDPIALAMSFLMIVVLAPLVEELFFRGWLFGALRGRLAAGATILITTFLFAIVHWDETGLYPSPCSCPASCSRSFANVQAPSRRPSWAMASIISWDGCC